MILSHVDPVGLVHESDGGVRIKVELYGELETSVHATVFTSDGTGVSLTLSDTHSTHLHIHSHK